MTVSVKVSDFAEDIAEPIVPILDALGMIGGDGDDLDLDGWDLNKAIGFLASYQRTSSLLSIFDLIPEPPSIYQMYRDAQGHVTDTPSDIIENWYSLFNFNLPSGTGEAGLTLYRKKLSTIITEDGTNCQEMILGIFVKIDGVEIGSSNPVLLDLSVSFPLLHISSDDSGNLTPTILLNDVLTSETQRQAVSVQAKIRSSSGRLEPSLGGNPSCESIQLRLAIGQEGVDVDFCLNDFAGSTGEMSDLTIDIASAGEGFNPDFGQLITLITDTLSGDPSAPNVLRDHLLPLIGLGSDDADPFVPQLDILNLLMGSDGPDSILDGIKSWALGILTNSTDFESWLRHLNALLSGSLPTAGWLPGDGTEASPWKWDIELGAETNPDGAISFEIWMQDGADGSTRLEFGLGGSYNKDLGTNGHNIKLNLDAKIASIPLVGGGPFRFLDDISLGFLVTKSGTDLFDWTPGEFPDARVAALNSLSGSIGSVAGGVTFGSDFQLTPYLRLHEVVLGGSSPREIDLLSGGLLGDLVSLIDRPMRNAISDLLASDPYLQRIGAILGLVSPRNDGAYFTRSNGWENDGSDLRIGGDMPNLGLSDFFSDPASTIGRYHSTLLEMNGLPGATGDMAGIKPWAFILEAFIDIVQSIISQAQGGSPIPIRTDGATDVLISSAGGTDAYKVTLTPSGVSPPLILEVDYTSSSNLLEILPFMGVEDIPIGNWMLMDLALSLDLVSLNLPNPSVADSQASNLTWVPGARLDATLHGLASSGGSGNDPIPLLDVASMEMSLDSVSAGLEWDRNDGVGYYLDANGFNFGGVLPDLSGLFAGLGSGFDFSQIDGLSWDGLDLHFPNGEFIRFRGPDWGWYTSDGSGGWSLSINFPDIQWPIEIPGLGGLTIPKLNLSGFNLGNLPGFGWDGINLYLPSGSGKICFFGPDWGLYLPDGSGGWVIDTDFPSITWPFDIDAFMGTSGVWGSIELPRLPNFQLPSINLRSLDGFDLPSLFRLLFPSLPSNTSSWDLSLFLELPQIRGLLGKFLALRGGRFGLFLSGFFRLDLDMHIFDLGRFLGSGRGIDFDWNSLNWSDFNWNGLDWSQLDWDSLDWSSLDWGSFDSSSLDWSKLNWDNLDFSGLNFASLDFGNLDWNGLDLGSLDFSRLNWESLNWGSLNWASLNWSGLNSGDSNWGSIDWAGFNWSTLDWSSLNFSPINWDIFNLRNFFPDSSFRLPEFDFLNLPSSWRIGRGGSDGFGLGPFALPIDWPELDWSLTLSNPFEGLRDFLTRLFSGCSSSGEPFVLPALRWIWGILSGSLPDLRLPDLGWGDSSSDGIHSIKLPEVPIEIEGSGKYHDPWAISLTIPEVPKFEIIFWLDPDGLPRVEGIQEVFSLIEDDIMEIINGIVTSVDAPKMPTNWTHSIAMMISQLSKLHPAAAHAVGRMGVNEIRLAIERFDDFLRASDGIISIDSQEDNGSSVSWANQTSSGVHNAHHLNCLHTPSIIQEVVNFHSNYSAGLNPRIIFIGPEWIGTDSWDQMISDFITSMSFSSTSPTITDFSALPLQTVSQIQNFDFNSIDLNSPFHIIVPSMNIHPDSNIFEFLSHQIHSLVQHIWENTGDKVFLVGHSIGGLAIRYYTEGYTNLALDGTLLPPDDYVYGATTISTPHHSGDLVFDDLNREGLIRFMHLLRLISAISFEELSSIDTSTFQLSNITGANNQSNLTDEYISQLANLIFNKDFPSFLPRGML